MKTYQYKSPWEITFSCAERLYNYVKYPAEKSHWVEVVLKQSAMIQSQLALELMRKQRKLKGSRT
jgi:hypothetical protein